MCFQSLTLVEEKSAPPTIHCRGRSVVGGSTVGLNPLYLERGSGPSAALLLLLLRTCLGSPGVHALGFQAYCRPSCSRGLPHLGLYGYACICARSDCRQQSMRSCGYRLALRYVEQKRQAFGKPPGSESAGERMLIEKLRGVNSTFRSTFLLASRKRFYDSLGRLPRCPSYRDLQIRMVEGHQVSSRSRPVGVATPPSFGNLCYSWSSVSPSAPIEGSSPSAFPGWSRLFCEK